MPYGIAADVLRLAVNKFLVLADIPLGIPFEIPVEIDAFRDPFRHTKRGTSWTP